MRFRGTYEQFKRQSDKADQPQVIVKDRREVNEGKSRKVETTTHSTAGPVKVVQSIDRKGVSTKEVFKNDKLQKTEYKFPKYAPRKVYEKVKIFMMSNPRVKVTFMGARKLIIEDLGEGD